MRILYICSLIFSASILMNNANGQEERVVNGADANSNQFPYQVLLKRTFANSEVSYCSGSIINEEWILTVAQCLDRHPKNGNSFKVDVIAGDINLKPVGKDSSNRQTIRAKTWHQHDDYTGTKPYKNDIALIKLSRNLTFNGNVKAANMTKDENQESEAGSNCSVSGWGKTKMSTQSNVLQWVTINRLPNEKCEKLYFKKEENMHGGQICAGELDSEAGSCLGDSGGPLSCKNNANLIHVEGLVSWGAAEKVSKCGSKPAVFTKVSFYKSWMTETMKSGCDKELSRLEATGVFVAAVFLMCITIAIYYWLNMRRSPEKNEVELEKGLLDEIKIEGALKNEPTNITSENVMEKEMPTENEQKTD